MEASFINDAFMAEDLEYMPGGWFIEYGDIKKYKNNENFYIMDSEGVNHEVEYNIEVCTAYNYYYEIWENCHEFGLPEGGDWTKNPCWLIEFIKMYDRILVDIMSYRNEKLKRRT